MSEPIEDNNLIAADADEVELKRADNAQRQARFRARRELEEQGLTVKKLLRLKAQRASDLWATITAAQTAMQRLSPEQRAIFDSEVFQEGMPDGSSAGLPYIQALMFDSIEAVKNDDFDSVRVDYTAEFYGDFVNTYSWATAMVYPRSLSPVEPGETREYPIAEFHSAVAKWTAFRNHTPVDFSVPDEEPPVTKRKRGRPKGKATKPAMETELDPGQANKYSQPPPVPQREYWSGKRIAGLIREQQEEAGLPIEGI